MSAIQIGTPWSEMGKWERIGFAAFVVLLGVPFLLFVAGIVLYALGASVGIFPHYGEWQCGKRWEGRVVAYDKLSGLCRIEINGQWVPEKNVVIRIEGK